MQKQCPPPMVEDGDLIVASARRYGGPADRQAIVQKTNPNPHAPMCIEGALHCALEDTWSKGGHLFLPREELLHSALKLLNGRLPVPQLRLHKEEVETVLKNMIDTEQVVPSREMIYLLAVFAQEDQTAWYIAHLLA